MEISEDLLCVFSAKVTEERGSYLIEVPQQEVRIGDVDVGEVHRIAILSGGPTSTEGISGHEGKQPERVNEGYSPGPPVSEGETRTVEIEGLGEQGDGIARVERGYVIIVPETEKGERVVVEIDTVKENVGFADVVDRVDYYE